MNNFWKQPAEGFDEATRGRTTEEVLARETQLGLKLPKLYKELMLLQNGGFVRKGGYRSEQYNFADGLLVNGASIAPLNGYPYFYDTFEGVLREFLAPHEIKQWANSDHCYPERLLILSAMDGHACLCLDYGWKSQAALLEPAVCLFDLETAGRFPGEVLREQSFDDFIGNLIYSGYQCNSYYYAIQSGLSIDELAQSCSKSWKIDLIERTDDGYGHFNFEAYYFGLKTEPDGSTFRFWLTPNRHRSGTCLFQEVPGPIFILSIDSSGPQGMPVLRTEDIRNLVSRLTSDDIEPAELLIPEC